ncbi:uncharacterized protein [Onthophagus taurus]|uniref:uncharacterized protein isoform X2 n=1 Tax=Onthophagus taurus TaxID=166361 RepID=UPI0039BE0422
MGRRNKCKPRMIPQQDKRICGSICFCQLIVVFSSVSLIYLTVAIYIPSYRAFHSGYEEVPVMCQTVNTSMINNCSWASCGEWCLTKTSGFCPQIQVTTRRNGTELILEGCTNFISVSCPEANVGKLKKYNCNNGTECKTLYGVFNCSLGHCTNMSQVYQCHYKADGFVVDSDKDNTKLNGFFECKGAKCTKIKRAFSCDRYCDTIYSSLKNVIISVDNTLHLAYCGSVIATTMANGREEGKVIPPKTIWRETKNDILMMSCFKAVYYNNGTNGIINASDCINGTIYNAIDVPKPSMNFTTFWNLQKKWRESLDPEQNFIPMQSHLTIYNSSHLYINLDGCVNTLKGECRQFLHTHGKDGRNQTAQSRFHCFHNKFFYGSSTI